MTRSKCLALRWRSFTRPPRTPTGAGALRDAPAPHEDHPRQADRLAPLLDLALQGGGVGGVPREGLDGHRAALLVGQQAEDDLRAVGTVVPAVAVRGERAAASLDIGGGDVEEDQAAGGGGAARE